MSVNLTTENSVKMKRRNKPNDMIFEGYDLQPISFNVVERPLLDPDGFEIPDKKGIFKVGGSGDYSYLSTVSSNYSIIKHSDIITKLEDGMNFKNASVKTILSNNGSIMQRMYTINDYSVQVKPGDEISPVIRVVNSYDGSNAIGFYVDALRLICTNGMMAIKQFMSMSYRHFGNRFELNLFAANASKLLEGFDVYAKNWMKWTSAPVTEERANLVSNYMPVRLRPMIESRMNGNFDGTKWGLYNAYTEALTHDFNPNAGATSADTKKIRLGTEVTKIFDNDWYWTADTKDIMNDLRKKRKLVEAEDEEIFDTEVIVH